MPSRYLPVSMPCASGENAMQPTPSRPARRAGPSSIQRLSIEYDGWWISSGVPSSRRIGRPRGCAPGVGRDADVERLARADGGVERAHRLFQRRVGVEAVAVEDVDVVHAHARQRLVEARQQVLARAAALPVRARPHVVARLGGEDQLVAVRAEVLREDRAEVALGAAVGRAVVVGQVEVGDAAVERAPQDGPLGLSGRSSPKLCHSPSEISGSSSPLRPQRRNVVPDAVPDSKPA